MKLIQKNNIKEIADDLKKIYLNWKNLTLEIVKKLHIAKEYYKNPGFRSDLTSPQNSARLNTWTEFCFYIGITDDTANRYLDRYIPEENKLLTMIEYKDKIVKEKIKKLENHKFKQDKQFQKEIKSKCFDNSDKINDDIKKTEEQIEFFKSHIEDQQKFRKKITEANKFQDTFFGMIDDYIKEIKTDTEKLEALQNIIKYCKRIAVKFQQNSIKDS